MGFSRNIVDDWSCHFFTVLLAIAQDHGFDIFVEFVVVAIGSKVSSLVFLQIPEDNVVIRQNGIPEIGLKFPAVEKYLALSFSNLDEDFDQFPDSLLAPLAK